MGLEKGFNNDFAEMLQGTSNASENYIMFHCCTV